MCKTTSRISYEPNKIMEIKTLWKFKTLESCDKIIYRCLYVKQLLLIQAYWSRLHTIIPFLCNTRGFLLRIFILPMLCSFFCLAFFALFYKASISRAKIDAHVHDWVLAVWLVNFYFTIETWKKRARRGKKKTGIYTFMHSRAPLSPPLCKFRYLFLRATADNRADFTPPPPPPPACLGLIVIYASTCGLVLHCGWRHIYSDISIHF